MFRHKTPLNAFISTELVDFMLCLGIPEVCLKVLQLFGSSHEVRTVVTPDRRWFPSSSNESAQAHNEGGCG